MKVVLNGGKYHGSMLHSVDNSANSVNVAGELYRRRLIIRDYPVIAIFSTSAKKPLDEELVAEWKRLLSDPFIFTGSNKQSEKRKPGPKPPLLLHPELHGYKYVLDCLENAKKT